MRDLKLLWAPILILALLSLSLINNIGDDEANITSFIYKTWSTGIIHTRKSNLPHALHNGARNEFKSLLCLLCPYHKNSLSYLVLDFQPLELATLPVILRGQDTSLSRIQRPCTSLTFYWTQTKADGSCSSQCIHMVNCGWLHTATPRNLWLIMTNWQVLNCINWKKISTVFYCWLWRISCVIEFNFMDLRGFLIHWFWQVANEENLLTFYPYFAIS